MEISLEKKLEKKRKKNRFHTLIQVGRTGKVYCPYNYAYIDPEELIFICVAQSAGAVEYTEG